MRLMSNIQSKSTGTEIVKIVLGTMLTAIIYGIAHDMITAHVDVSYFTIFHPHIISSNSPVAMALLWGVLATWWMGLIIGVALALTAQLGPKPPLSSKRVIGMLTKATIGVYVVAMATLVYLISTGEGRTVEFQPDPSDTSGRFYAVWITHNLSYMLSAAVAVGLCVMILRKRAKLSMPVVEDPA